jgi:hypothetical protein
MSRPIARVALFTLVSLILVAAAYMTVQGVFAKAESAGVQAHTVSGLQTNLNHDRSTVAELESLQVQSQSLDQPGKGHGCESEARNSPID